VARELTRDARASLIPGVDSSNNFQKTI